MNLKLMSVLIIMSGSAAYAAVARDDTEVVARKSLASFHQIMMDKNGSYEEINENLHTYASNLSAPLLRECIRVLTNEVQKKHDLLRQGASPDKLRADYYSQSAELNILKAEEKRRT